MKGYKGFDRNLMCCGKQYEVGKEYLEGEAGLCEKGMHFWENPLDVLRYYPPGDNRYCLVEAFEVREERSRDSRRVCKRFKVVAEISMADLVYDSVKYVRNHRVNDDDGCISTHGVTQIMCQEEDVCGPEH